jgi:hypothetical protein
MRRANSGWRIGAAAMLGLIVVLAGIGGGLTLSHTGRAGAAKTRPPHVGRAAQSPQDASCLGGGTLSSTELYNPTAGTWSSGPNMTIAREEAVMVPLDDTDGRILVAGGMCYTGQANGGVQSSAEIYDPLQNTWTAVAPMHVPRVSAAAVLLPNGTVFVAGGEDNTGRPLASAETYNPTTNQWTMVGNMYNTRIGPSAVVLTAGPNAGDVLVVGGIAVLQGTDYFTNQTELFNPTTGQFTLTGILPSITGGDSVDEFVVMTLPNGNVFLGGGITNNEETNMDSIYNVQTGKWTTTQRQVPPRFGGVGVTLADGTLLALGGYDTNECNSDVYSPSTSAWTETPNPMLDCGLQGASAVLLQNGQALVAGGWAASPSALNPQGEVTTDCELYNPTAQTWTATGSLLHARRNAVAALLTTGPNAGDVLIAGGDDGTGAPQPPSQSQK